MIITLMGGVILPNVSLCVNEGDVHYNPSSPTPPTPSHDFVEIGGIKWATMNVGANSITDKGLYFQWGDTQGYTAAQVGSGEGQKYFGWADYKYGNGTSSPGATGMTKYNATDGLTTLEASDDAVVANWGGNWRMPTEAEFNELLTATTITKQWTTVNSVNGYKFYLTADPTKYVFFPAAGYCNNGSASGVVSNGYYWSSSLLSSNVTRCRRLFFSNSSCGMNDNLRYLGLPVRGVLDE